MTFNGSDSLATQAQLIVEDCENILDMATEKIVDLPEELNEAQQRQASAAKDQHQAQDRYYSAVENNLSKRSQDAARQEMYEAQRRWRRAYEEISSGRFDVEYRKAVVRQVAGLLREESLRRLDGLAARATAPETRRVVAECKHEVGRATRYVLNMFSAPRPLQQDELRKARVEARELLDEFRSLL